MVGRFREVLLCKVSENDDPFMLFFTAADAGRGGGVMEVLLSATLYHGMESVDQREVDKNRFPEMLRMQVGYYRVLLEYVLKRWNVSFSFGKPTSVKV